MDLVNWPTVNGIGVEVLPADGSSDQIDDYVFYLYTSDQLVTYELDSQISVGLEKTIPHACIAEYPSADNVPVSVMIISIVAPSLAYNKEVIANFYFIDAGKRVDFLSIVYPVLNQGEQYNYDDVHHQFGQIFVTDGSGGQVESGDNILIRTGGIEVSFADQYEELPFVPPKPEGSSSGLTWEGQLPAPVQPDEEGFGMSGQRNTYYSFFKYSNGDNPFKSADTDRVTAGYIELMKNTESVNDIVYGFGETVFG